MQRTIQDAQCNTLRGIPGPPTICEDGTKGFIHAFTLEILERFGPLSPLAAHKQTDPLEIVVAVVMMARRKKGVKDGAGGTCKPP
jgi:hypothetical protein